MNTGVAPSSSDYLKDPDVQLMLKVRADDQGAFGELVRKYQDRLIGIFTNMFRDSALAEDLAQDVFLRIYRARNSYEPTAKFSTWLFQIANNLASNSKRSKGRKREVQFAHSTSDSQSVQVGEQSLADKSALMPARLADTEELRSRVLEALEVLNDRQRMAILLHRFEEMSYIEIGNVMELSPQAVKSLLSRAREHLRVALEGYLK